MTSQPGEHGSVGASSAAAARPRWKWPAAACLAARVIVCVVAAFWVWFAAMNVVSDGVKSLLPALGVAGPLAVLAITVWRWPVLGACLAVGAGVAAAYVFHHPAPLWMMAVPLAASGVTLLVWSPRA